MECDVDEIMQQFIAGMKDSPTIKKSLQSIEAYLADLGDTVVSTN